MFTTDLQAGQCPSCGSTNLEYFASVPVDDQIKYPFTCNNCKFEGIEWCNVAFAGMTTIDGEQIEQE